MRRSIRTRLVALSLAVAAAAVAAASAGIVGHGWHQARTNLVSDLQSTAAAVGANCAAALTFADAEAARETLESLANVPSTVQAALYAEDGVILAEYRRAGARGIVAPPARPGTARSLRGGIATVVTPVVLRGRTIGALYVRASTAGIDRDALRHAAVAVATALIALAAAFVMLQRLIRAATRPLVQLSTLTETIAAGGDYRLRAAAADDDEVNALAVGLNQMLGTIEERDAELEAHRRRLEAEVSSRTKDLADTNARLQVELQERRRAEAALSEAAHHWRVTFDGIRDGICVLDPAGCVLHANRAMHDMVGASPGALAGSPIADVLRRLVEEADDAGLRAGNGRTVRRGGNRWFELQRDTVELPGEVGTGYIQVVADVTRQHALQEQLAQSQKMQAVGQLAGGVAHDFNNALSVILTLASSLHEELPAGELRSFAEDIERAGHRAAALTRQLLAFSRKQVLHPRALQARAVVCDVAAMIERLIGERIRLALEVDRCSGWVHMDPTQLEQVLVNLAVNARDAMPDGGVITIAMDDVEIPAAGPGADARVAPGPYVCLRVEDTGCGIAAGVLSHIFEPFFTTKEKGKGTGLGLAIVYGAMQQSGGHIDVQSAPGVGTTFTIHLPRVAPAPAAEGDRADVVAAGQGERVLVVEDEPQLRDTVRRLLLGGGYRVVEASRGEEGLAAFASGGEAFDLVLTDLVMPGMGGLALGKALRDRSDVPVLYMSGYSEEMASGREAIPAHLFLQKPFDRATLLRRVHAALHRRGAAAA